MELSYGYSNWKYDSRLIKARAKAVITAVDELALDIHADGVVLTGSSGTWLGGLLQAHDEWPKYLPIVLCRKEGERSHGGMFEGPMGKHVRRLLLIDDFVESGATVHRVKDSLSCRGVGLVAVLEHDRLSGSADLWCRRTVAEVPVYCRP